MQSTNFENLPLKKEIISNLKRLNFTSMTPIQQQSLPYTLQGKDIIAQAQTGSGKTIAFSLAVLNKLDIKHFRIQTLILAPTRELANQIAKEMKLLAKFTHNIKITTLCGGVPYKPQVHSLSHQAHIIIGTAGRILKHLTEKTFDPSNITTLVLDEADRMLDMGFEEDINKIINFLPTTNRQTLLFSATYPENIEQLSKSILQEPIKIKIENKNLKPNITEIFYQSNKFTKLDMCYGVLENYKPNSTIIFCNTKIQCDQLANELENLSIDTLVLHSDLDQKDRVETLILFENKSYPILIATDVASRGLDINNIDLIINYDLPFDKEVYTHRIGRTARAGQDGIAISLVDNIDDNIYNIPIQQYNLSINYTNNFTLSATYDTLFINGGKKQKLRAGDILGALTAGIGLDKNDIGKIDILDFVSYVAINKTKSQQAYDGLTTNKIKGKYFKIYFV